MTRRHRLTLIGLLLAALGVNGGIWRLRKDSRERQLQTAWSRFSRCLIGAPLGADEDLARRLRSVRQAALRPLGATPDASGSWPERCASPTSELHAAINAVSSPHPALTRALPLLHELYVSLRERGELGDPREIWQLSRQAGLVAGEATNVPRAPAPLANLVEPSEPVLGRPHLHGPSGSFVLERAAGMQVCKSARDDAGRAVLRCDEPIAGLENARFADAADVSGPWLYAATRSSPTLELRSSRASRSFPFPQQALIAGVRLLDETRVLVLEEPTPSQLTLSLLSSGGKVEQVRRKGHHQNVQLLGDDVVWLERGELGQFVFAARVHTEPLLLDAPRLLLPAWRFEACAGDRSAAVVALRPDGRVNGITVRSGDEWSSEELELGPGARLTCDDDGAVVTELTRAGTLSWVRCTGDGCTQKAVELGAIPSSEAPLALPIGERILLIHATAFRDVRGRVAVLDQLASTPDRLLADEGARGPALEAPSLWPPKRDVLAVAHAGGALLAMPSDRVALGYLLVEVHADGSAVSLQP